MPRQTSLADRVNPNIGRIGHLLQATQPAVMRPHSMAVIVPAYTPGVTDNFLTETIHGFPLGAAAFFPDTGGSRESSLYDHDREDLRCYYGSVYLEDNGVQVEYTAHEHALFYKITFPENTAGRIAFRAVKKGGRGPQNHGESGAWSCGGSILRGRTEGGVPHYCQVVCSRPPERTEEREDQVIACFPTGEPVELRVGLSHISADQAEANLEAELINVSFPQAVAGCKEAWEQALGAVRVKGGTEEEQITFYTALYRMMNRMQNISEYGRYYSAYDGKLHDNEGHDFYVNDGIWDTYRCAHPLQLLLHENRQMDMIHSYLRMYRQSGWLPSFPHLDGNHDIMVGKHATAMIADTWLKGYRNFDIGLAYEAMLKNAEEATKMPWTGGPAGDFDRCYFEKGFFPALAEGEEETLPAHPFERRQSVAVTLEVCYDDWCLGQIAKELGHEEDYRRLSARAENYRKLYHPETGFMSPRLADGSWAPAFNPKLSGGQGGRAYFAECNAWTYTWHVQHQPEGLIQLMGGKDTFCDRLDQLFREQYEVPKYTFLGQFPDSTGLMGQFCMGNEPSFHIPYLYNYGGQPWKTQRRIRELMRLWFGNSPLGICGDEDGGAMSAWYTFSAMGLYPVCPGKPVYDIGSPVFDEITIHMENGNSFHILAHNQNPRHKYIQSASLNGKPHNLPWLDHTSLAAGGTLELQMGLSPNKEWGTG